ncbi:MAG TPA: methyltransferase domain-containing protein [Longimicrobiales bacterium]
MSLRRARADELLDEPRHDMAELAQSLGHVASVNRWLGGTAAVLHYLEPIVLQQPATTILDVATGSADIPVNIVRWARREQRRVRIVAADLHPQMLEVAQLECTGYPEITLQRLDALHLPYADNAFDISLLSLALHHFPDELHTRVLCELARVTRTLVLVNDLERTRLNYLGARLLGATYWRGNRLTRHDGPLSVLRSFTRAELQRIGRAAGLGDRVDRRFFQRIVLVGDAASAKAAAVNTECR